jgi:hypothetical protein
MATRPATQTALEAGRRSFTNLKYLYFTPWVEGEDGKEELGATTYNLVSIVADSTSVEQDDNETSAIDHEFSAEPLDETITLGAKTFTTECIDFQNPVLKALFGWETDDNGNAFAPIAYKPLYVCVEMGFNSTNDVVVLPKIKMNSKAVLASMKTDMSRANITGTCYSAYVKAGELNDKTDMAVIAEENVESYQISAEAITA